MGRFGGTPTGLDFILRHQAVMEGVDEQGKGKGLSILGVSRFRKGKPLEAELVAG